MERSAYHGVKISEAAQSADKLPTAPAKESSTVNHPPHYNAHPSGVECIDIIENWPFNLGTAVKYIWRAGLKPGADHVEDLQKAVWYIKREIRRLQNVSE